MPHTINLEKRHQEILIEALLLSLDDKEESVLKDPHKIEAARGQYIDAAEKFMKPVKCGMKSKNIFTWTADQINHSPHIKHMEIAQHALIICAAAANDRYEDFIRPHNLLDLITH
jgi:hypothetical protein